MLTSRNKIKWVRRFGIRIFSPFFEIIHVALYSLPVFHFLFGSSASMKVLVKRCAIIKTHFMFQFHLKAKKPLKMADQSPFLSVIIVPFPLDIFATVMTCCTSSKRFVIKLFQMGKTDLRAMGEREKGLFDSLVISLNRDFKIVKNRALFVSFSRITFKNFRCVYRG